MNFIYPRKITIKRAITNSDINDHSYEARLPEEMVVIKEGVKASIQLKGQSTKPPTGLPNDASNDGYWHIFCRLANGTIQKRDEIIDDLGIKYEVTEPYCNSLGYKILAKRKET